MSSILYITWGNQYSGVFQSQVIDNCIFFSRVSAQKVKLVSFVDYSNYKIEKQKIVENYQNSIVLPALTSRPYWFSIHAFLLVPLLLTNQFNLAITRGVVAFKVFQLITKLFKKCKIIYDGRGAVHKEWNEYDLGFKSEIKKKVKGWEKSAVLDSDFRVAVSNKLVAYWNEEFGYKQNEHAVIPCTFLSEKVSQKNIESEVLKKVNEINKHFITIVYAGGVHGWQSLNLINNFLMKILNQENIAVIFLAGDHVKKMEVFKKWPKKTYQFWLSPNEVFPVLNACDYGLLLREDTVTNNVASPTKFAEYLFAGLKVLISPNVGDFSKFVEENNVGHVIDNCINLKILEVHKSEKSRIRSIGKEFFSKSAFKKDIIKILKRY